MYFILIILISLKVCAVHKYIDHKLVNINPRRIQNCNRVLAAEAWRKTKNKQEHALVWIFVDS